MKRFLTICCIAVALFTGVATTSMSGNAGGIAVSSSQDQHQTVPTDHSSFFSAGDLFLPAGLNNAQIRLTHSVLNLSYRSFPSVMNAFRMHYTTHIGNQKFCTRSTLILQNSAKKQLDGYYLYHLRKLLIWYPSPPSFYRLSVSPFHTSSH